MISIQLVKARIEGEYIYFECNKIQFKVHNKYCEVIKDV